MKRCRSLLAAAALSLAPMVASATALSLEAHAVPYPQTGAGELTVLVRNAGTTAIALPAQPDWDARGALTVVVTSPTGAATSLPVVEGPLEEPEFSLAGGTSLGVSRRLDAGTFATAGTYTIVVTYSANGTSVTSSPVEVVVPG